MFKFLVEVALILIGGLILITQIILPLVIPSMDFFWLFKSKKNLVSPEPTPKGDVDQLAEELRKSSAAKKQSEKKVDTAIDVLTRAKRDE
jgi:hypothetical protein